MGKKRLIARTEIHDTKWEGDVSGKQIKKRYEGTEKLTEAFIKLEANTPYERGAGQMNKLLKINLTNYCLSRFGVSHA